MTAIDAPPSPLIPHPKWTFDPANVKRPEYVYVASSWRNKMHAGVCAALTAAGIEHYDFKNPPGGSGFSWREVMPEGAKEVTLCGNAGCGRQIVYGTFVGLGFWEPDVDDRSFTVKAWRHADNGYASCDMGGTRFAEPAVKEKNTDWVSVENYLDMIEHPRALEGFRNDMAALERADAVVMVLPCGKSAHLELGYAVGAGKRTAVLLEDPIEPELMYRMCDYFATSMMNLLAWLGVDD